MPRMPPTPIPSPAPSAYARLLALTLIHAVLAFLTLFLYTRFPLDLTFPENSVVLTAAAASSSPAANASPVYPDWRAWPHRFAPYGPALYYPPAWAASLAPGDSLLGALYRVGRLISLAALAALGLIAVACARRAGLSRWLAAAGGLGLLVGWPGLMQYVVSFRPDAPMVGFAAAAACLALGGLRPCWRCVVVLLCLWISAAYKPGSWAAPLLVAALAWRREGPRVAFAGAAVYVAGLLAAVAFMQWSSGGHFLLNQSSAMASGFALPPVFATLRDHGLAAALGNWPVLLRWIAALAGALWLLLRAPRETPAWWIALWFLLALAAALAQSFKMGSDINYMLEPWALSGVVALLAAAHAWQHSPRLRRDALALVLFCLVLPSVVELLATVRNFRSTYQISRIAQPLNPALASPPGSLLFDTAFTRPDAESHAIPDALIYHLMVKAGRIDPAALVEKLRTAPSVTLSPVSWQWLVETPPDAAVRTAFLQNFTFKSQGAWHIGTRR